MESLNLKKPHLIIMIGIPSSGKSFFAEHFAQTFKAPIISFNRLRQELFNNPTFSKDEDDIINRVANYMLDESLKTKQTLIYEGLADSRSDRTAIAKKSRNLGYEPLFIWVQTDPITAKKRAIKSGPDKAALNNEQFDTKLNQFNPPHESEKAVVISGKHTYASQLKIVLKQLITPQVITDNQKQTTPNRSNSILIR